MIAAVGITNQMSKEHQSLTQGWARVGLVHPILSVAPPKVKASVMMI